jgi:hypothetical protein
MLCMHNKLGLNQLNLISVPYTETVPFYGAPK